jgi:hypothetical protein
MEVSLKLLIMFGIADPDDTQVDFPISFIVNLLR